MVSRLRFTGCCFICMLVVAARLPAADGAEGIEFFEKHVRPALVTHCFKCHGEKEGKGGLRLDSKDAWLRGGDTGPAIVPGKPDESLLIQAIRYGGDYEMPPDGKLPDTVIHQLERWVEMGAPDPRGGEPVPAEPAQIDIEAGRQHWSYRPLSSPTPPTVQNAAWPVTAIDRFVLARLEQHQLPPAADAPREVLARRLYYDLLGLPPTPEQIDEFLNDPATDAYERLIDRLLASHQFGERWGRHWLDVARYAESMTLRGFIFKEAWRYRDYVIDTLNADRPFDHFLREQIAGDLLPATTLEDQQRQLIATTFLALGNINLEEQDKRQLEMDMIDEQLDVIGKGILAQTITCARCHDHKFDPIPTRDYYALAGILKNVKSLEHANVSKWIEVPLPLEADEEQKFRLHDEAVAALQERINVAKEAAKEVAVVAGDAILSASELPGIVVDDAAAKRVGEWKESQFQKGYVGNGYVHDLNEGKGEKTLTFTPELPRDGRYEVRFSYTPGSNRAKDAEVTVFGADGEKTIQIDQRETPPLDGRFVSLGQYRFERNGQSFVIVSNAKSSGHVVADAVQFIPVEMLSMITTANITADKAAAEGATAELKKLEAELKALTSKAPYRPSVMTVVEEKKITNTRVNIRGSIHNLGAEVPRGFLQVCLHEPAAELPPDQSGRLELAEWLTNPQHPLTARVFVNRAWHWLYGVGLVRTVDNFGTTGETPSHPELLDYLARDFVRQGYSVKHLVRQLVLSRTYRQSSASTSPRATATMDPENRLLSRMNRRRLNAESLRDAMLLASGQLRPDVGGMTYPRGLAADYGFEHQDSRRSVYLPVFRNSLPDMFEAFDYADASVVTGARNTSTVAPQALLMMNHPFVLEQSRLAAERLLSEPADDLQRIELAFRWTLGRRPSPDEGDIAQSFLASHSTGDSAEARRIAWSQLIQSLFASIDFRYLE